MKITAIAVTSVDGRFTKGGERNIYHWSSKEDFEHFKKIRQQHNLIVMGSGTFEPVKDIEEVGLKPEKERLRVVMTKQPEKYKEFSILGQLEFTSETPQQLITRLEQRGYKEMLFMGGGKLFVSFLQAHLIDELYLTIEPNIFGKGDLLDTGTLLDINLQLLDMQKLNQKGTLVLHYQVVK